MQHRSTIRGLRGIVRLLAAAVGAAFAAHGCSDDGSGTPGTQTIPPAPEPIPLLFVEQGIDQLPTPVPVRGALSAVADLDGDGWSDLVQPADDHVRVFWGSASGFDEAGTTDLPPRAEDGSVAQAVPADFDGDGQLDLFLVGNGRPHELWLTESGPSLEAGDAIPGEAVAGIAAAAADLDGDGDEDVVVTATTIVAEGTGEPHARVLINDGSGALSDESLARLAAPELRPYAVAIGDLDGDGSPDLFFTGDQTGHRLLLNDGTGVFRDAPPDALPSGMPAEPRGRVPALGDVDGDGALDVVVPSFVENAVYLNDGAGRLYDETAIVLGGVPGTGRSALLVDLDLDLVLDVVVAAPAGRIRLLRNDGGGRLFDYGGAIIPIGPARSDAVSVGAGDFDGDGDPDLFVSRADLARPWVLVNWYPNGIDDEDVDGVPDEIDVCLDEADPEQTNRDANHFSCASGSSCAAETGCELAVGADRAYLLCRTAPLAWPAARAFCQGRGADLVVIEAQAENALLAELGVDGAWLGLSDSETEGTFAWVSGASASYAAWAEGEPNDSGGVEDCAMMTTAEPAVGGWNDAPCETARPFICEDDVLRLPADPGDACDTCPTVYDPDQEDEDDDGTGDACETPETP